MRLIDADALVDVVKNSIDEDKEMYPEDKVSIIFRAGMKTVIGIIKEQDTVDTVAKDEFYKGYTKGLKKGKSIGSHQAYNHFLKQGHWEDKIPYDDVKHGRWILFWSISTGDCFVCSECGGRVVLAYTWKTSFKSPADKYRYCPHCGTRMDGVENES